MEPTPAPNPKPTSELTSSSKPHPHHDQIREAVHLFNRGDFFECHEVLEAVWLENSGEQKLFLQGLIQVAVSFYHLRRGNFTGSERLLRAALQKLSRSDGQPRPLADANSYYDYGIDVPGLIAFLSPLPDRMKLGMASPEDPAPLLECRTAPGASESSL